MDLTIHVRDSVKQIDKASWLVGSKHVLRHLQGPRKEDCLWENSSDGSYYTLSTAPVPLPDAGPLAPNGHASQIHDAGDASAVFCFGDALIIKVRIAEDGTRREPETIAFLAGQQLSFDIPTVLFYMEDAGKTYLVEPYAPGKRLNEAWWEMSDEEKEYVATRVSKICAEIKVFQSNVLTGVDYNWMDPLHKPGDYRVEVLQQHCKELGMDCSVFVLSHNDLGPTNIIVNGNRIMVLDWEMAGYVPLEWVRTKFAICGALCAERVSSTCVEHNNDHQMWVEQKLGEMGFPEVTQAYIKKRHRAIEEKEERSRGWTMHVNRILDTSQSTPVLRIFTAIQLPQCVRDPRAHHQL
ncbi:kinase-like domain-containing protein [Triangularia verruculosa]|uniref:Kinase-like domain-containing protein n=1 Tax=Triangularia verruculosa TaxID=2587418 RepID=A0AAN7AWL1_9PEZI|nr:kinase-like domain-containing protein [Triangularia verruculosa]